jgi:hypothetical protein
MKPIKRSRISNDKLSSTVGSFFDQLPDEIVVSILALLSSSANTPADLAAAAMTYVRIKPTFCYISLTLLFVPFVTYSFSRDRRFSQLAQSKLVLNKASMGCLAVRAKNWSDAADRFLQRCAEAGNTEASYILGMVCHTNTNFII